MNIASINWTETRIYFHHCIGNSAVSYTSSVFSFKLRRWSTNFAKRLLRALLLFIPLPLPLPCRVWLLKPPLPHVSFWGFDNGLEEIPRFSLMSTSLSMHPLSGLAVDDDGWEGRTRVRLFRLLCLISVHRSSVEDESFSLLSFSSSLSSDPRLSITWFCLLERTFRWMRCDLVTNEPGVSLRLLTSASDCRWTTFAIEAWICQKSYQMTT